MQGVPPEILAAHYGEGNVAKTFLVYFRKFPLYLQQSHPFSTQ
jgi:hypothetical protein